MLNNPIILYLVGLIAAGNLYLFIHTMQYISVGLFIITALFASFYTKNTVAILVVAMVLCNILSVSGFGEMEGFRKARNSGSKRQRRHSRMVRDRDAASDQAAKNNCAALQILYDDLKKRSADRECRTICQPGNLDCSTTCRTPPSQIQTNAMKGISDKLKTWGNTRY